jgi:hypothetical protein
MFLREAIKNGIEAIGKSTGKILITQCDPSFIEELNTQDQTVNPKKLMIANDCPSGGLTAKQLLAATDISSSINKIHDEDNNFGQGIKLTGLSSNRHGFLWITQVNNEKYLAWLRYNPAHDQYERYDFYDTVAEAYENDCPDKDILKLSNEDGSQWNIPELDDQFNGDYNAYIFLGNEPKQDTTKDPFGDGDLPNGWLVNLMYRRFAFVPSNITVRTTLSSKAPGKQAMFKTRLEIFENQKNGVKKEVVELQNGKKIHYHYDPDYNGESAAANKGKTWTVISNICTSTGFSSYIFENEHYDVRSGIAHKALARHMGIPYGSRNLTVHIEIPKSNKWSSDSDRRQIEHNDKSRTPIVLDDFTAVIKDNRPQWFLDKIEELKPVIRETNAQDILDEIAENMFPPVPGKGTTRGKNKNQSNNNKVASKKPNKDNNGDNRGLTPSRRSTSNTKLKSLKIEELFTKQDLRDASVPTEELANKVAMFDDHTIWMNYMYLDETIQCWNNQYLTGKSYDNAIEQEIDKIIKNKAVRHLGMICTSAYYKLYQSGWTKEDLIASTNMATLTNLVDIEIAPINNLKLADTIDKMANKIEKDYDSLAIIS